MSNYLKQKLEEKHISQVEFAKRLGLHKSTITQYVKGNIKLKKLPLDRLSIMALVLDIPLKEFIEGVLYE